MFKFWTQDKEFEKTHALETSTNISKEHIFQNTKKQTNKCRQRTINRVSDLKK